MSEAGLSPLAQGISLPVEGEKYNSPGSIDVIRRAGDEAIVLLKNDEEVLPIKDERVAVFGRCQINTFFVGYGSGGDVKPTRKVSILDGIKGAGINYDTEMARAYKAWCPDHIPDEGTWGKWPFSFPEMPVSDELMQAASDSCEKAVVVIGRAAGEDRDNTLTKGSFFLTDEEEALLEKVDKAFENVIVLLNIGGPIDFTWLKKYSHLRGLLIVWQLGQEMGHAVADVLTGRVSPSGHLSQTIAEKYDDYPSAAHFGDLDSNEYKEGVRVGYRGLKEALFPFGYGLSYTTFDTQVLDYKETAHTFEFRTEITNTGKRSGKGLVQLYATIPGYDFRTLVGYGKSDELAPGESEVILLSVKKVQVSIYDTDSESFVIQKGFYEFFIGDTPYDTTVKAGQATVTDDIVVQKCESITEGSEKLKERIHDRLPAPVETTVQEQISFDDVRAGKYSLDDFIAQMTPAELSDLSRGEGDMDSPDAIKGNAGVFGGITPALKKKDIPIINTSDGPSGLRVCRYSSLLPIGTAVASTWNRRLIEELYSSEADDMKHYGVDVLLGPGMNIQRNPLCGRNFEYYSEDPYLSGMTAGAAVRGIQSKGAAACIKHFACNNQETNRYRNSSDVDEKTLREIYLKPFEIAIRESSPKCIMTSYNQINGVWAHYNYDLVKTVLRKEWGYKGLVMTDWWMQLADSPEFPGVKNNAYRIRAGVNLLMPGALIRGDVGFVHDSDPENYLTLGELQENARYILNFILLN